MLVPNNRVSATGLVGLILARLTFNPLCMHESCYISPRLYIESQLSLGFLCWFLRMHCVDFNENTLFKSICWSSLPCLHIDPFSIDKRDSNVFSKGLVSMTSTSSYNFDWLITGYSKLPSMLLGLWLSSCMACKTADQANTQVHSHSSTSRWSVLHMDKWMCEYGVSYHAYQRSQIAHISQDVNSTSLNICLEITALFPVHFSILGSGSGLFYIMTRRMILYIVVLALNRRWGHSRLTPHL